nr:cold shock domain-containing protein [Synechococcus sp. CCY 9618]
MPPPRFLGELKSWNDERGFGFIEPVHGGKDIFVHIKAFPSGSGRPSIGQSLTFEVEPGREGKSRAHSVQYVEPSRRAKPHRPSTVAAVRQRRRCTCSVSPAAGLALCSRSSCCATSVPRPASWPCSGSRRQPTSRCSSSGIQAC